MYLFAGEKSAISFEGRLANTALLALEGASAQETVVLKRATLQPELDFVILPLTKRNLPNIERAISSKIAISGQDGIIHVQVEMDGKVAFAGYDGFHSDTVTLTADIPTSLLDEWVKQCILHSYQLVPSHGGQSALRKP
jgi:hypothetical protein